MSLTVPSHAPDEHGQTLSITPASAGWDYVGFEVFKLTPGQSVTRTDETNETCLVLLSGFANINAGSEQWDQLGERMNVFEDKRPYAVYVPPKCEWTCEATSDVELAVCTAPATGKLQPRLIRPEQMGVEHRGDTNMKRTVHDILPDTAEAESLLVVEVYVDDGNWSGFPPHKHDEDIMPTESLLEETYYHKIEPEEGFAFQRIYTADGRVDESVTVKHDQAVLVPFGYHPLVAPPRHRVYFINVMAGPTRAWVFREDPVHAKLLGR